MELTLDQALKKGIEAHKAGKVQEADRYYSAILKAQPKHPDANHYRGVLAVGIGKVEEALPFFKTALDEISSIDQYWLSYIDALIKLDRIDDAKDVFEKAKKKGINSESFIKIGIKLCQSVKIDKDKTNQEIADTAIELREDGMYDEAIDFLKKGMNKFPEDPNLPAILSHCFILKDNLEDAIIYLEKAKFLNPNIPSVGCNETRLLLRQKKVDEALIVAQRTNDLFPEDIEGMGVLGSCLRARSNFDDGLKYLNKAIGQNPNYAEALINRALINLAQDDIASALIDLEKVFYLKPHIRQIWDLIISLTVKVKNYRKAVSILLKMIEFDPTREKSYLLVALYNQEIDDTTLAIENFEKILEFRPNDAVMHLNLGLAFMRQNQSSKAIEHYKKAILLKPDFAEAYNNMGIILNDQGKLEEAIGAYKKALSIKPASAVSYYNMGNSLKDQGRFEEAIEAYKKALSIKPDYAEAYYNMGITLKDQGRLEEAIGAYKKALSIRPNYAEAHHSIGITLQDQGKLEETVEAFQKAILLKPDFVEAYNNMGITLSDQGKSGEAIEAYKKALFINPDYAEAHENLSFALLNIGRLREGLDEYEWRWEKATTQATRRNFLKPLWTGKNSLKGKRVLLWCEQGVGDTITWSSRLPFISTQADHCILECQEKLVPLLTRSFPNIEIRLADRGQDAQRDDFDYHLPLGSLHRHFISEISENTNPDAFLVPDPIRIKFWKKRLKSLGDGPYIGLGWKSSDMSPRRLQNYAALSEWSPIFKIHDVTFVNLQYTDFLNDLANIRNEFGATVHNFDNLNHYNDLDDVAALCCALDMVISTKITVPLISAGVGTLTKLVNWRQSPWNNVLLNPVGPSIDIFERNTWEPWKNTFSTVANDIIKFIKHFNNSLESSCYE